MPQLDEFGATLIAGAGMLEDFFWLQIKEPQSHCAIADNAFQMAASAATTEFFFGVERDDDVAAFTQSLERDADSAGPLDTGLMREAREVRKTLLADSAEARLLHGDLHYDNILVDEQHGVRLIDPKGLRGDPLFDLGYLVSRVQPLGRDALPLHRAVSLRLDVLTEAFRCDAKRLAAWAFVAAALSAVWTLEDHGYVSEDEIDVLKRLAASLRS